MEATDGEFDVANDSHCRPVSQFRGFGDASTTTLELHFDSMLRTGADIAAVDKVVLTITTNKHKEVMNAIVREINKGGGDDFIVVADDSNSVYADAQITACAITVTAAA